VLDRNPDNYFADVEQSAFDRATSFGHWSFAGQDAPGAPVRLRRCAPLSLGINHTHIPVNAPHATKADNYGRDGAMRVGANGGRSEELRTEQLRRAGQTNDPHYGGLR